MKYIVFIFATFITVNLFSQDRLTKKDSLESVANSRIDSIAAITKKLPTTLTIDRSTLDSLAPKKAVMIDSLHATVDSLNKKLASTQLKYVDSLNLVSAKYQNKLDQLTSKLTLRSSKIDSTTNRLGKYTARADSLSQLDLKSIRQISLLEDSISQLQSSIKNYQQEITGGLTDKLDVIQKQTGDLGFPNDLGLPSIDTDVSGITNKIKVDNPLSGIGKNNLSSDVGSQDIQLPVVGNSSLPTIQTGGIDGNTSLPSLDLKTELPKGVSELKTEKISDLQNVKDEDIIEKLPIQDELKVLKDQEQLINEQGASIKSYKNLDEYKKQTLLKSRQVVEKQFEAYQQQVDQAVSKVSEYQSRLGSILSKKGDLPKKRDALRKLKPFERMVPGITLQVKTAEGWLIDVNPSLRYRITSYWSAGAGWNHRLVLGDYPQSFESATIFGPRMYSEVVIFKGISARIDVEEMNAPLEINRNTFDERHRVHVWSYVAGMKKDFSFIKRVTGNVQFMYTLYTTSDSYPYPSRFNIRFGFEYFPKKKIRKK